jgi:hypothetical protein
LVRLYDVTTSVLSVARLFNRLIDTRDALWDDKVRTWARAVPDAHPIVLAEPGRRCYIAGVVERMRIDPVGKTIQAVVMDGTGRMAVKGAIRRPLSAHFVVPGRAVFLSGLAVVTADGGLMLQDPLWREIRGPEET